MVRAGYVRFEVVDNSTTQLYNGEQKIKSGRDSNDSFKAMGGGLGGDRRVQRDVMRNNRYKGDAAPCNGSGS